MHSAEYRGVTFNFNSDFSGDVRISNERQFSVLVPGQALIDFIAYNYALPKQIAVLEESRADELLGIF